MGFFSWLFCLILVVALVLLLFPFSVRIEFEAGERGARAFFFFFKKKIYEVEKKWGKGETSRAQDESRSDKLACRYDRGEAPDAEGVKDDKCVDRESHPSSLGHDRDQHLGQERSDCPKNLDERREKDVEGREAASAENKAEPKAEAKAPETPKEKKSVERMDPIEAKPLQGDVESREYRPETSDEQRAVSKSVEEGERRPIESTKSDDVAPAKDENSQSVIQTLVEGTDPVKSDTKDPEQPKKEKRKLSDREFWTIILTPDLDARAFRYALKILSAVLSLFRVRFIDCFVEGIQSDYMSMGYGAALNGILKSFPYVSAWDFRMDWCHEKELRAAGAIRMSVNLLRIFCFVLEALVLVGILAFIFWRRRAHVIKTNELPELGFIRKKILEFILED